MKNIVRRPKILGLVIFSSWITTAHVARASGYLTARFGSDHGQPAVPSPYSVYFNPASMGKTQGTNLVVDGTFIFRYASYQRSENALSATSATSRADPIYVASNTGKATLTNLFAVPYLGITSDLGTTNFRLGYAVYIPFGGQANWDRSADKSGLNNAPGAQDGVQRWQNISGQIFALYNTIAASYTFEEPRLSVGISASIIHHSISTVRARNSDGGDDVSLPDGTILEGRSYVTARGLNFGFAVGLHWDAIPKKLALGLSYTSQPGLGESRLSGELKQQLGQDRNSGTTNIDFLQEYPDLIRLGSVVQIDPKWQIRTDFEYVRWSKFQNQCIVQRDATCPLDDKGGDLSGKNIILNIPRKWRDAIGLRLGPAYQANENIELFGSAGLTTPAVPKSTLDVSTIDSLRIYLTLGAKFQVSKKIGIAVSYNHIAYLNVNTEGFSQQPTYSTVSRSPSAAGAYVAQIGMINANFGYAF